MKIRIGLLFCGGCADLMPFSTNLCKKQNKTKQNKKKNKKQNKTKQKTKQNIFIKN